MHRGPDVVDVDHAGPIVVVVIHNEHRRRESWASGDRWNVQGKNGRRALRRGEVSPTIRARGVLSRESRMLSDALE